MISRILRPAAALAFAVSACGSAAAPEIGRVDLPHGSVIALSDAERAWVLRHPVIRLGVEPARPPLDFVDQQGNYGGLSADYMRAVAQRLGLRLELVPGLSWAQVLDGLKAHRIDLVTGVVRTPERERYIAFSQPYFYMPWVIIGRANASVGPDLRGLRGRTVACVRSYFVFERLATDYPEVRLLTTASEAESLDAVARGHADAAISQLAVATPLLTQNYLGRLRVIALVDEFKEGLRFGVRSDWPELAALLNKGLASMTEAEQEPIRQRWLTIRIERGTDWWAVAKVAVPVGAGLLIIVAIVLVANRRLQRAKREVSDQLAFVSAMIDTYPSPVFYKDRHGRYLGCNPAYEAAFGQTRGAMRGKTVLDMHYLPPEMRQKLHEDDLRLLAEGGTFHEPLRVKFADGQMHDTLYWKTAFNLADGGVGGMLGVLVDITVQKQQEAALAEARDQAEAATRSKSAFLAAMSHEIRTPMNGILGMLEILGLSRLDDEQTHAVGTIQDSARALLRIIDDILDFSKIEAGRLTLESRPVDLCDVLESTAQLFVSNARGNGLELRCFVDARIRRAVLGDSLRLRQVLSNLLSNAIKFTPRGRVTLAAELIEAVGEMIRVRIQVTDTGIGVSEENQKGLFQPFVQAESSTSRRFGGTGLGLTICMRLVEMMHGRIEMRSREGEGTSMIVTLPFEPDREPLPEARGERLQGLRLLLVTDDPEETRFYPDYFRFWDCDVRMTRVDQAGAVAAEDSAAFDVIICGASALDVVRAAFSHPSARSNVLTQPWQPHFVALTDDPAMSALKLEGDTVRTPALKRSRLIGAVAIAAGRASPEVEVTRSVTSVAGARAAPTIEEAVAQHRLILLAEDHPVNQQVILRQLNLLGFAAELAENGRIALEKWQSGRYALVLTDCHMPEMDGYQLAGAIRAAEEGSGRRMPIIALTANALQGEADRCLAAGMDDCLTKPVEMKTILERLDKWMPAGADAAPPPVADQATPDNGAPVDRSALTGMFGDDAAAIRGVLDDFLDSSQGDLSELTGAMDARDADHLMRTAHRIKGAARIIGANALADASHQLELAGRNKDLSRLDQLRSSFLSSLEAVAAYIRAQ